MKSAPYFEAFSNCNVLRKEKDIPLPQQQTMQRERYSVAAAAVVGMGLSGCLLMVQARRVVMTAQVIVMTVKTMQMTTYEQKDNYR